MKRKIALCLMIACSLISNVTTLAADDFLQINTATGTNIEITGIAAKESPIMLMSKYLGADYSGDGTDVTFGGEEPDGTINFDYMDGARSGEDGSYQLSIPTNSVSGFYLIRVSSATDNKVETKLREYLSPADIPSKISDLNLLIAANDSTGIDAFVRRYGEAILGKDADLTYSLSGYFLENGSVASQQEFSELLEGSIFCEKLKDGTVDKADLLQDYFTDNGNPEYYSKTYLTTISDTERTAIIAYISGAGIKSYEQFNNEFFLKLMQTITDNYVWQEIMAVLDDNIDEFSLETEAAYNNLKTNYPSYYSNVAKGLAHFGYTTNDALEVKINELIAQSTPKPQSFGGGGGGSNSFVPTVAQVQNTASTEKPFEDMSGFEWASEAVNELYAAKIISGKSETEFAPSDSITREEFAAILCRAFEINYTGSECPFEDVDKNAWYYEAVATAYESGITGGISNTEFGVGRNITRQDMCAMLYRTMQLLGRVGEVENASIISFSDSAQIRDYAREAVQYLASKKIINGMGDGRFEPEETANRASVAAMIYGYLKTVQ